MTYEGAVGQTAEEIQTVFHFPESDILQPNFAALYNSINKQDNEYTLNTGNALWVQQDYQLLQTYLTTVEKYYGGKAVNLDFIAKTEKSRQIINSFIEQQTNDKIKDLMPDGILNEYTRIVLTNAIYFKGTWAIPFDTEDTLDEDFTTINDEIIKVPMMYLSPEDALLPYAETDNVQILEMPYEGEEISMIILLPKEQSLDALERSLTIEQLHELKSMLSKEEVEVYLPKFKFETKYFMKEDLSALGMPTAFTYDADFSKMAGTTDLFIQDVIHQAFIEVNEEGTEAAAATAVVGVTASEPILINPIFRADHPFIFIIQQKETGAILFIGRVVDPSK